MAEHDRALTAPDIARRAGVSASTIWNWTRKDPPLKSTPVGRGAVGFTWTDLLAFCRARPDLRGSQRILNQADAVRALQVRSDAGSPPVANVESALAVARAMRSAAASNLDAALVAARQAEATATAHREQLEQLKVTFDAYDSALIAVTAPTTLHD